jgi:hypothetical protein
MQLKDIARRLRDEVWAVSDSNLPSVISCGNGCPPKDNRRCFHALLKVPVSGIARELLPPCFPSYKTVQRRLGLDAWRRLAERYEQLNGINWDQILPDGSKEPSRKGGNRRTPPRAAVRGAHR